MSDPSFLLFVRITFDIFDFEFYKAEYGMPLYGIAVALSMLIVLACLAMVSVRLLCNARVKARKHFKSEIAKRKAKERLKEIKESST